MYLAKTCNRYAYDDELSSRGECTMQSMVEKANPGLNANKMAIGSKIFIPDPSQE